VISPMKWFGRIDPGYSDVDIVPNTWIKL